MDDAVSIFKALLFCIWLYHFISLGWRLLVGIGGQGHAGHIGLPASLLMLVFWPIQMTVMWLIYPFVWLISAITQDRNNPPD